MKRVLQVALVIGAAFVILGSIGIYFGPPDTAPTAAARESSGDLVLAHDITMGNYLELANGISYGQAIQILGKPGEEMSRSDIAGTTTVMYQWSNGPLLGNMNALFQNDKLVSKAQFGLK